MLPAARDATKLRHKLEKYADTKAAALLKIDAEVRTTLVLDDVERTLGWATGGVARATHRLLLRLAGV